MDFYCAALMLVIEIDGEGHFTEEGKVYALERTGVLEGYGLQVFRFTNVEVLGDFEGVCGVLMGLIPPTALRRGEPDSKSPFLRGI